MPLPGSKQNKRFTYADYLTWPEEERWELIDGEAFDMTPAPGSLHQEILGNLFAQIHNFLEGKPCKVYQSPLDVLFPVGSESDEATKTVVQPDILVVCDPVKITDRGCRGAPDWIIEVISPSTASKDHIRKRNLYERHEVKEYWLVHPIDRTVTVYFFSGKRFDQVEVYDDTAFINVRAFPGLEMNCSRVFPVQPKIVRESPRKYLTS